FPRHAPLRPLLAALPARPAIALVNPMPLDGINPSSPPVAGPRRWRGTTTPPLRLPLRHSRAASSAAAPTLVAAIAVDLTPALQAHRLARAEGRAPAPHTLAARAAGRIVGLARRVVVPIPGRRPRLPAAVGTQLGAHRPGLERLRTHNANNGHCRHSSSGHQKAPTVQAGARISGHVSRQTGAGRLDREMTLLVKIVTTEMS